MADETREVLIRLLMEASNVTEKMGDAERAVKSLRSQTDIAKHGMDELQAATAETLDIVSHIAKGRSLDPLIKDIAKAKAEISLTSSEVRALNSELNKIGSKKNKLIVQQAGTDDAKERERLQRQINALTQMEQEAAVGLEREFTTLISQKQELVSLERELADLRAAQTIGKSEIKAEMKQGGDTYIEDVDRQRMLIENTEAAKLQMLELVRAGGDLDSATRTLRQEGLFDSDSITRANAELKTMFDFGPRFRELAEGEQLASEHAEELSNRFNALTRPIQDIAINSEAMKESFKTQLKEMVAGGEDLDVAYEKLSQNTKKLTGVHIPLTQALREVKAEFVELEKMPQTPFAKFVADQNNAAKVTQIFEKELRRLMSTGLNLSDAYSQLSLDTKGLTGAQEPLKQAFLNVKKSVKETGEQLSEFEQISERVIAVMIIGFVLGAARKMISALQEIIDKSIEAKQEFIKFEIAVRAAQKDGLDVTFEQLGKDIDNLGKRLKIFTERDLTNGYTKLVTFGRQFGVTSEEIKQLAENIGTLAVAKGFSFEDAIDTAIDAAERGRVSDRFSDLFKPLTEPTLNTEAFSRGLAESVDDVDEYARAIAVLQIAMEEATKVGDEFEAAQEGIVGAILEQETAIQNLKDGTSENYAIVKLQLLQLEYAFLETFMVKIPAALATFIYIMGGFAGDFKDITRSIALDLVQMMPMGWAQRMALNLYEPFLDAESKLDMSKIGEIYDGFVESLSTIGQTAEDASGSVSNFPPPETEDNVKDLTEAIEDLGIALRESIINMNEDLAREERKYEQDRLERIAKHNDDLHDLYAKYQFDVAGIYSDANGKIKEAQKDFRDKEIKAEEDYQEKLRKLREQFLFDLEDALRERDAKQVLRLLRQFNLRQDQLARERAQEKKDNKRDLQDQLEQIKDDRAKRLAELKREYEFRRQQMVEDFALEQKLREEDHKNQMDEIRIRGDERNREILRKFEDQHKITADMADKIYQTLLGYFGPGGAVDAVYSYMMSMIVGTMSSAYSAIASMISGVQSAYVAVATAGKVFSSIKPFGTPVMSWTKPYDVQTGLARKLGGRYAEGGTLLADKPTSVLFGEKGPEIAHFAPLNRTGSDIGKVFGDRSLLSNTDSFMKVQLWLSPDLEARVVDKSVGVVADVLQGRAI